ncbi:hypothetical protein EJB05_22541, partial [Eragrostis curvula]
MRHMSAPLAHTPVQPRGLALIQFVTSQAIRLGLFTRYADPTLTHQPFTVLASLRVKSLAKRGLPHLMSNVSSVIKLRKTLSISSQTCVFVRDFWFLILVPLDFLSSVSGRREHVFVDWWRKARKQAPKDKRKGLNSLIILGAWML